MGCQQRSRRLMHPDLAAAPRIQWPSFPGTATLVGTSADGKTTVYVDDALQSPALANALALVKDAPRINALDDAFFGATGGPCNVILFALGGQTDGTGGADHASCDFQTGANIEVCVAYGKDARVSALYEAERSECQMNGNLCGYSTGEALSRWCASAVSNNALGDFATAPTWARGAYANWVDRTFTGAGGTPGDGDPNSTGCGMCFLSWLLASKFTLAQIARAMVALGDSGTLAQVYNKVTGAPGSPWSIFLAAVKALPGGVVDDDPFKAGVPPTPPPPTPVSPALFSFRMPWAIRKGQRFLVRAGADMAPGVYDVAAHPPGFAHGLLPSDVTVVQMID